jgi:hypothetical protein
MPCLPTDVPNRICLLSVYLEEREDRSKEIGCEDERYVYMESTGDRVRRWTCVSAVLNLWIPVAGDKFLAIYRQYLSSFHH